MYKITCRNCYSFECTFEKQEYESVVKVLTRAFNYVEVVDGETGEVMYEHYTVLDGTIDPATALVVVYAFDNPYN